MISPAIAAVLTRWISREGWKDTYLRVNFKQNRRYWLIAWVGTPLLLLLGTGIYFAIFPQYFDQSFGAISKILTQEGQRLGKTFRFYTTIIFSDSNITGDIAWTDP